jgi:hypothetical protein
MNRSIVGITRAVLIAIALAGCSENPVNTQPDVNCEHIDGDGLVIHLGAVVQASQWQATVSGGFALDSDEQVNGYALTVLDADSLGITVPAGCPHEPRYEVADTTIAQVIPDPTDPWRFAIRGKAGGSTSLRVRLWHVDHADFTSQPLPITVTQVVPHVPIGAAGAMLFRGCSRVASWALGIAGGYGKVVVPLQEPARAYGIEFIDAADVPVDPSESGYDLAWQISNPAIAAVALDAGERWRFRITPQAVGHTTVAFTLRWNGAAEYTTGAFDVVVWDTTAAPAQPMNFVIRKSGVRHVFVQNGAIVPSCGATIATGYMPAPVDTIGDLYSWDGIDFANCSLQPDPSSSQYSLAFDFADPCLAGVVNHPEHTGEYFIFHLRGLALGDTQLRLHLLNQNAVVWRSPPLPVRVNAGGTGPLATGE